MEKPDTTANAVRPTKKQRELLTYIETFITEHGYSPSYREIMKGLSYNSVATVALHVNSLITRGHLRKRDHSARSIELVSPVDRPQISTNRVSEKEEKWLVKKIEHHFSQAEQGALTNDALDGLYVLVGCLKVLGLDGAAQSFIPRLSSLKSKLSKAG